MKQTICSLTLAGLALLFPIGSVTAGELNPPGPPGSTMKTLDEVEARIPIHQSDLPLTINTTAPKSYYLTSDLYLSSVGDAITVQRNDTTIDLNGFTITGPGMNSGLPGHAIDCAADSATNVTVKNGTVRQFGSGGIRLDGNGRAVNIRALSNDGDGISVGPNGVVENCVAVDNTENGIRAMGLVQSCIASENGISGIVVISNSGSYGAIAANNTCSHNGSFGIFVGSGDALIRNNICSENADTGIFASDLSDCRIVGNTVVDNDRGIFLGSGSLAHGNAASSNATINYDFAANSVYGPTSSQTSGEMTTTNPWANIIF